MDSVETRKGVAEGIRKLRKERRLTQSELAEFIGLSQAHLSKIEHGYESITAEQLIRVLQKYSLPLSYFVSPKKTSSADDVLQNALVHLGAQHLREVPEISIPERLVQADEVIAKILITATSARLITALTPVIAKNYEQINFHRIAERLRSRGLENRFWWVVEGTYHALEQRLGETYLPRELHRQYQRAFLLLERKKVAAEVMQDQTTEDELDRDLLSSRTVQLVKQGRDKLAKRWHIITRIKKADFAQALKDSEGT